MQKHRFIPDKELPPSLLKPLIFGDREQIEALNGLEVKINRETTKKAAIAKEKLRYFDITIEYCGTEYVRVLAVDEDDAKEKAREKANFDDIEIDSVSAIEVKGR